ncbi:SpoIIE family protein phosphatase [Synechococcales cyanobacterium C]|uniref:SpoIIE family protein phosphatase n=1 Tax=Petrachloros mirabilis ULC683 TaxID=2781853 RepID=A0A8K2A7B5_9CYAN|nr:PP2C family protein-serine/threonine phosphatase [Petrachloros mirabilis]NCJ06726.1 SpoIIE family protein phosphatase [Petrachloros mirabilis ULC683]
MAAVPTPQQPAQSLDYGYPETYPPVAAVAALKKLVAKLQREQTKAHDLLSSLSFSLRSFNNLNQFLALIPLIGTRVTDADAAALILCRNNGQVSLEHLYCHEGHQCHNIRWALEKATRHLSAPGLNPRRNLHHLDQHLGQFLPTDYRWFSTAILIRNLEPHERGRLYLFSSDPDYEWTETRQKLAQLVADQTAVAIENEELTVELRKKERLARELEIGAEIQARLLPNRHPQIEGVSVTATCKTANQVGGDYYDFIPIYFAAQSPRHLHLDPPDRWSIVIGDVMGKGVPAGLIMTMTRGILRTNILNRHSPGQILQNLNQVMYTDLENSNRFVTLFYSEYDPTTQILRFSNAAHHPPLLWRAAADSIERLDSDGMLIGLDPDSLYPEAQVRLYPGDTIIYYTDGFTDAANANGGRFEEENLILAFRQACHTCSNSQAILDELFATVEAFVGSQPPSTEDRTSQTPKIPSIDDRTLIVFQVQPSHPVK